MPPVAEATAAPGAAGRAAEPGSSAATAVVLVDYALSGKSTPTPEPQAVAQALPADLAEASLPLRVVLAHGTVLRSYLLTRLPADHDGHADWPPLGRWLAALDNVEVRRLLADGIAAVLGYGQPPGTGPTAHEVGSSIERFRRYAEAALAGWPVPDPAERAGELLDPASVRATLLDLHDAVWQLWLDLAWPAQLPELRAAAPAPIGSAW